MSFSSTWADVTSMSQNARGKACLAQSECFLKAKAFFQSKIQLLCLCSCTKSLQLGSKKRDLKVNLLLIDIDLGMPAILWLALGLVGASRPGQPAHSHAFSSVVPFFLTTWFAPRLLLIETHLSHCAQDSVLYPSSSI